MESIKLADDVWYFKNVIEDSEQITDKLDGWLDSQNQDFLKTLNMPTWSFLEETDESTFKVLDVWYNKNPHLNAENYMLMGHVDWWKRSAGIGFTPHTDFARNPIDYTFVDAHITVLGYYSDPGDYDGGEICFDDYDVCIKPEKGSMVVMGHKVIHSVTPITSGTRIISNQHLIKRKDFYKFLQLKEESLTKEDKIELRKNFPQYENKNGNIKTDLFTE